MHVQFMIIMFGTVGIKLVRTVKLDLDISLNIFSTDKSKRLP